jgi:hypothetical protein
VIGNDVSGTMDNQQLQLLRRETLDFRDLTRVSSRRQSGKET